MAQFMVDNPTHSCSLCRLRARIDALTERVGQFADLIEQTRTFPTWLLIVSLLGCTLLVAGVMSIIFWLVGGPA